MKVLLPRIRIRRAPALLLGAALLLAFPPSPATAGTQSTSGGSTTGPNDDLGTLPSTQGPPLTPQDDLGTLPARKGGGDGPVIVAVGPVQAVEALLVGVSGPGTVTVGPVDPASGRVTAVLEGNLTWALRPEALADPSVRLLLVSGDVGGVGVLRTASGLRAPFTLAPAKRLPLPVVQLHEMLGGEPVALAVRGWSRMRYHLAIEAEGAHLLVRQRVLR